MIALRTCWPCLALTCLLTLKEVDAQAPGNDECAGAFTLAEGEIFTGSTQYATHDTNLPCIGVVYKGVWFNYTPLVSGTATVSYTTYDASLRMEIVRGDCGELVPVACGDTPNTGYVTLSLKFTCVSGVTYHVAAGSMASNGVVGFTMAASARSHPHATVTVVPSPAHAGAALGGGTYRTGSNVVLTAVPAGGWLFSAWNDGGTANPRAATVPPTNITYTALFTQKMVVVTALPNTPAGGTVSGGGPFRCGSPVLLSATPSNQYLFAGWNDGDTANPRSLVAPNDSAAYTANFIRWSTNVLDVTSISQADGAMTWSSTSGFVYDVQWSGDLASNGWSGDWRTMTGIVATGPVTSVKMPLFFRIAQRP